ncbi:SRPBCC family protein [Brachybacterium huguangmaarense]|uniref:SRPBCC family protein n=1 Tax=Brachybacterium huguangmaarense TaxID=1652028 RepID=A0ABY6G4U6_9MICO|nr:SRPBCC family protein [Brachybacterium huguangmaarense]UYG17816.1 SRPBCC family protein [Brachybacterium huguangmaarense]
MTPEQAPALGSRDDETRVVSASRRIDAPAGVIFELIADPARQPEWDGNDNLAEAASGQRVRGVGDVFRMALTGDGAIRENHVVEFEEGERIAWLPAPEGEQPPGHLWRWELEGSDDGTLVIHTYDWTDLHDEARQVRARATTSEKLAASIDRLAALAEREAAQP